MPKDLSGRDERGPLTFQSQRQESGNTLLHVILNDIVAGKNQVLHFELTYTGPPAVYKNNSWIIKIPKLSNYDQLDNYSLNINVPEIIGPLVYASSSPEISLSKMDLFRLVFSKSSLKDQGLNLIFSRYKSWGMQLDYHYSNQNLSPQLIAFNLPSDDTGKIILLKSIFPKPVNISSANSTGWQAWYLVQPKTSLSVTLTGQIQTASSSPSLNFDDSAINPSYTNYYAENYIPPAANISLSWTPPWQIIPFINLTSFIEIINSGNSAAYNIPVAVYPDGFKAVLPHTNISVVPPGGTVKIPLVLKINLFQLFRTKYLNLVTPSSQVTYNIPARLFIFFYALATAVTSLAFITIAHLAYHSWSLHLQKRKSGNLHR